MFLKIYISLCFIVTVRSESPSVIIVGAGPSGIAAATRLLENSITNVTILEAENRIGGRVYSIKIGDAYGDLGAEFCHGEKNNIVYELARNYDLLDRRFNLSNEHIYYSDGSVLNPEIAREIIEFRDHLDEDDDDGSSANSLGEKVSHRYNTTVLKKYENDANKLKIFKEGLNYLENWLLPLEGAYSWFDTSAQGDYEHAEGHQNLIWKGVGYKVILDILMKSYPDPSKKLPIDNKIHLNTEVQEIIWNQNDKTTIITSNNRRYTADYVIFTPSIGVLKHQNDLMFDPSLPHSKKEAIESIGFAGVIKLFVHFSEKWWHDGDEIFSFFWSHEDLTSIHFPEGPRSWVSQIISMVREPFLPNVWVLWVCGDLVPEIEKLPLGVLKNGSYWVLNKFLGKDYKVSEIDRIIPTQWVSNKHFRGTYSFLNTGKYKKGVSYQRILSEPLKNDQGRPTLLFAGEATHPTHHSTVHGAIETGHREADRIIQLHRKS